MPTSKGDTKLPLMTLPKCKGGNKEKSRSANNGAPVDFLPDDLLSTLNSSSKKYDDLGPGSKKKPQGGKRPVDSLWQHANTRSKFKHLTDQPLCTCGAGKDISFLADAGPRKPTQDVNADFKDIENRTVGDTLIPSEFHVIKSKGVLGLEIHEDKYGTTTDDHEAHLTIFPSMKPAGRQEALHLIHTMDTMLERLGVEEKEEGVDAASGKSDSTAQIQELLKLVREEQHIYNIAFNEIIRQVSVECVERGQVLAKLRDRYAKLLDRIPRQVKSLHEEVLAQRCLDRRLTEELSTFKSAITSLSKELREVQEHDREVTRQAMETQEELNNAIKESEKNASLLAEYHDLYELQRRRLDNQIAKLLEERDLWSGCAHMLSTKVADKHRLVTAKRLHLHEKAWYKLASYFSALLTDQDSKQIQSLSHHVREWQEIIDNFEEKISNAEKHTCRRMSNIRSQLMGWAKDFERVVTPVEGSVHVPENNFMKNLFETFKTWEEILNSETERFSGEALLACEDSLLQMGNCVDKWTEVSVGMFSHHPTSDGSLHVQYEAMLDVGKMVEQLHHGYRMRMSGENGVAPRMIHIINNLETWVTKLATSLNGGEQLFDSEWIQLADHMQVQWMETLSELINLLSPDGEKEEAIEGLEEYKCEVSVSQAFEAVEKWLEDTMNYIENEDSNIVDQVSSVHGSMVRWMITVLIRLAPDMPNLDHPDGPQASDEVPLTSGSSILAEATTEAITQKAEELKAWFSRLTKMIVACVKDIVMSSAANQKTGSASSASTATAKQSLKDLEIFQAECDGWIEVVDHLVNVFEKGDISQFQLNEQRDERQKKTDEQDLGVVSTVTMDTYMIGHDDNVRKRSITEVEEYAEQEKTKQQLSAHSEINTLSPGPDNVGSSLSLESLSTLKTLQQQLSDTEERAQTSEDRAFTAESALKEANERIRALEKQLSDVIQSQNASPGTPPVQDDANE